MGAVEVLISAATSASTRREAAGAGLQLPATAGPNAIAGALTCLLAEPAFHDAARRTATAIAAERPDDTAADGLHRDLRHTHATLLLKAGVPVKGRGGGTLRATPREAGWMMMRHMTPEMMIPARRTRSGETMKP